MLGSVLNQIITNTGYRNWIAISLVYNEIQKKSAGSILMGARVVSFFVDGDDFLIPEEVENDFSPNLSFYSLNTTQLGINAGYMYTLVFRKKFYITLSIVPGFLLIAGDYL